VNSVEKSTFQPLGSLTAVKYFARILAVPSPKGIKFNQSRTLFGDYSPKGIKFNQSRTLFGDYFNPTNQSYYQCPVGWKVTFSMLCTQKLSF